MTRKTNARIAGITFLLYIVVGLGGMAVPRTAPVAALFPVVTSFCAIVLGVTLHAITRDQDRDLALLGLLCRVVEGVAGGSIYFAVGSLLFSWLLLRGRSIPATLGWLGLVASALLVVFLPVQMAGYFGGPGSFRTMASWAAWLPMLVYEVALALWLIIKAVPEPVPNPVQ
jgi:hypothetical protein